MMPENSFLSELKRRNVLKVAIAYVILSWLLIQVADVVFPALNLPDWSVTLVIALLLLGFLPILIFAWIYELTPEGLERTEDVDHGESITPETGRKIDIVIFVLSALAIGIVALDRMIPERAPIPDFSETIQDADPPELAAPLAEPPSKSSIAVLPFVNLSADPEQEYFSDGLAEELLNILSKIPELLVTSRTSAFSFKGKEVTVEEVAKVLNVAHILEGSVRKSGDKVRITAQLIDTEQDVHLWSESWDRTLDDIFAIQDEIATQVAAKLMDTVYGSAPELPKAYKTDIEAYTLFLQARHMIYEGTPEKTLQGIEMYKRVLDIDPNYEPALVNLGFIYLNIATHLHSHDLISGPEAINLSRKMADKALSVDPNSAYVYAVLSGIAAVYEQEFFKAAQYLQKGLEIQPNNKSVLNGVAALLHQIGRHEEALQIFRYLSRRDPLNLTFMGNIALTLYATGDLKGAQVEINRALTLSPDNMNLLYYQASIFCMRKQYQRCLDSFAALSERVGSDVYRLEGEALALPALGREHDGALALDRLQSEHATRAAFTIVVILTRQGHYEEAIAYLDKIPPGYRTYVVRNPEFTPLHDSPEWDNVMEKWGSLDKKLNEIDFDIDLPL